MVPENSKVKNAQPTVIRVRFTKVGSLQFISHLDLCRTMKSALIRAKAPLWYSEGFNPHPRLTFALPLSIGTESVSELLDVKLDYEVDPEQFRQALDAETTDEMKIIECYYPQNKLNSIEWAEYELNFDCNIESAKGMFDEPYIIMKRSKSGEKETDISPLTALCEIEGSKARVILSATSEKFLNPEYTAQAICKKTGAESYTIMRTNILKSDKKTTFR
ncbi:MAG: TIGR03936 family radical SAM-associated protein [Clostridia bacterium]|nr:TIGR03936 family radical SAM-associated protein [Clostridia bacterium]